MSSDSNNVFSVWSLYGCAFRPPHFSRKLVTQLRPTPGTSLPANPLSGGATHVTRHIVRTMHLNADIFLVVQTLTGQSLLGSCVFGLQPISPGVLAVHHTSPCNAGRLLRSLNSGTPSSASEWIHCCTIACILCIEGCNRPPCCQSMPFQPLPIPFIGKAIFKQLEVQLNPH